MRDETRGMLQMTCAMLISGTIGWFVIVSGEPVTHVVFWRCVFGALTLLPVCAALGLLKRDALTGRQLVMAVLGGVALVSNWLLLFASYSHSSISIATAVYNTQPFMLVAFGALFMRERITASRLSWLCLSFCGVLMIAQAKSQGGASGDDYLVGVGMALAAAACYAAATLVAKALKGVPPQLIAFIQVVVGIAMLAPLGALTAPPSSATAWTTLATLGVAHTGLMFVLLYSAIQKLPTSLFGALSFIYPLVAFIVDFFAFGRRLHWLQLLGAAAILTGAAGTTLGWNIWRQRAPRVAI